jgi:hypothetical protein
VKLRAMTLQRPVQWPWLRDWDIRLNADTDITLTREGDAVAVRRGTLTLLVPWSFVAYAEPMPSKR